MKIRKLYKIESSHIVKGAYSKRCANNYHGHGGKIEVFLRSSVLDDSGMVIDFSKMNMIIGSFIDLFDHSVHLYECNNEAEIEFFVHTNDRFMILPCNPTAENYALLLRDCINQLLKYIDSTNTISCDSVAYHETDTGYAISEVSDLPRYKISDVVASLDSVKDLSSEAFSVIVEQCELKVY